MLTQEIRRLLGSVERNKDRIVNEYGGMPINKACYQALRTIDIAVEGLQKVLRMSEAIDGDDEPGAWIVISTLLDWQEKIGSVLNMHFDVQTDELHPVQESLGNLIQEIEESEKE